MSDAPRAVDAQTTITAPVDPNDLGFGAVVSRQARERLLNRDGSFNVRREGLGFVDSLSSYHWLLELTWPRFLLVLSLAFLAVNLIFAALFFAAGPDALHGLHAGSEARRFLGDFFFIFVFTPLLSLLVSACGFGED